ncbi:replication factor A protein 3 [Melampsora americana]|nr:replication factor A protein 3 [Melampsora americana]
MDATTPRINSSMLPNFIGRVVRISGKLISCNFQSDAVIESCDGGQITVLVAQNSPIGTDSYLEIIGKVESDNTIREMDTCNFGEDYDLALAQAVVEITNNPIYLSKQHPCFDLSS